MNMTPEWTKEEVIERINKFINGHADPHAAMTEFWDCVLYYLNKDSISRKDAIEAVNDTLSEYIPYFRNDQIGIPLKCARALNNMKGE